MRVLWMVTICLLVAIATIGSAAAEPRGETLFANSETLPDCQIAGDFAMAGYGDDDDDDDDDELCVCHMRPGKDPRTICGGGGKICAHLAHGDTIGECPEACGGPDGVECDEGQFCKVPPGECEDDAEGECQDLPGACPSLYAPVCGCDGNTYSNACFADAAGVAIESDGECEDGAEACGGDTGNMCEMGQYCRLPEGECGEYLEGQCADMPVACPDVLAPVCGCDDMTYDNACLAAAAGVNVARESDCDADMSCGGETGNTCEEGYYCSSPEGECDAEGMCEEMPTACPPVLMQVCGCDGVTYDNACVAAGNGASVASAGACDDGGGEACGGTIDVVCDEGQFCKVPEGECAEDAEGVCTDIPTNCPNNYAPVCGCDGVTYDNACLADAAGVAVESQGECDGGGEVACGGDAGDTCGEGQYCMNDGFVCEAGAEGVCADMPESCTDEVDPVCGCDGTTYDNACLAAAAGVNVMLDDECPTPRLGRRR